MTYKPEGYYIIKGKFTWPQLDPILSNSWHGSLKDTKNPEPEGGESCGLASSSGGLTYKIYTSWDMSTGSRVAHVVLHPDGICFSGALNVEQDWAFAKELWRKMTAHFEMYQVVKAYIQPIK